MIFMGFLKIYIKIKIKNHLERFLASAFVSALSFKFEFLTVTK